MKAILIPGNGGGSPQDNWFPWLEKELPKLGIEVINVQFPDPELARKKFWLPFIEKLGADENTILIGHSSGGLAAMRYAETNKLLGSILVGACYTDLGYDSERQSGYYDDPWNWDAIKKNQKWWALMYCGVSPHKKAQPMMKCLLSHYGKQPFPLFLPLKPETYT